MGGHKCRACIVWCIDFRLHDHLSRFVVDKGLDKDGTDIVRVAGVVKNLTRPKQTYARDFVMDQLEASHRLHDVREIYLVNHEDCGAYGLQNIDKESMIHKKDLQQARAFLKGRFPDVKIFAFYQRLDGAVEEID
jgi:carbonic anhydrase